MKRRVCKYSQCFSIAVLAGALSLASETPLLANPQQSSQPTTTSPKVDDSLPDAPQSQSAPTQRPAGQQDEQQTPPSGAAAAKAATPKGAPAAQPAGAAVAPVRQHGHRSLLIKLGLIAGVGVAVGSAVALSAKSPSRPPGAPAAVAHP